MIYLAILLLIISGFFEGAMDILQFHFHKSIFSRKKQKYYWDPTISWRNKYRNGDPLLGPKFLFSTTFLVGLTDGWHTFKLLRNAFIFIALPVLGFSVTGLCSFLVIIIIGRTAYGIGFWSAYYKILRIK